MTGMTGPTGPVNLSPCPTCAILSPDHAQMAYLSLLNADGATLKLGNVDQDFLEALTPGEVGTSTWYKTLGASIFPGSARLDQVLDLGWNLSAYGLAVKPGEAAMGLQFESFYAPGGGKEYMEHHLVFIDNNGNYFRPQSWMFDRNTGDIEGYIEANLFQFLDGAKKEWMSFNRGFLALYDGMQLRSLVNNRYLMTQLNAEKTTYLSLLYLNASNQVAVGIGATKSSSIDAAGVLLGGVNSTTTVQGTLVANQTATINGDTIENGAVRPHRTAVADSDYVLATSDYLVAYGSLSSPRTVVANGAGTPQNPVYLVIKDESGSASDSAAISFTVPGGTIDGAPSKIVVDNPYGVAHVYCTGSACFTY